MHRCRPFLGGVPRAGSPASTVLLRHSDSPSLVLASLRFLVRRYPGPDRSRPPRKRQGLPGSWGSLVYMPCSRTPAGPRCRALARLRAPAPRCCLPLLLRRRLPQRYFGALSHGLHTRCLRFAARVDLWSTQDSLPAGGQPSPGGQRCSRVPRGSTARFQRQFIASSLPRHVQHVASCRTSWRTSGSPGRSPARGPHRSGRAGFPHPALRCTGCCPSCHPLNFR